jgi:hypothetical protein
MKYIYSESITSSLVFQIIILKEVSHPALYTHFTILGKNTSFF